MSIIVGRAITVGTGGDGSDYTATLKAFGDQPTIDLPIRIILRGDM